MRVPGAPACPDGVIGLRSIDQIASRVIWNHKVTSAWFASTRTETLSCFPETEFVNPTYRTLSATISNSGDEHFIGRLLRPIHIKPLIYSAFKKELDVQNV